MEKIILVAMFVGAIVAAVLLTREYQAQQQCADPHVPLIVKLHTCREDLMAQEILKMRKSLGIER